MSGHVHPPSVHCPYCRAAIPAAMLAMLSPNVTGKRRRHAWLAVIGLLLLVCLGVAYRYRGQIITVVDLLNEATGSTSWSVAALALAAWVAACLAGWLLLPFLLAWAYLDLRHRLGPAASCCWAIPEPYPGPGGATPSPPTPTPTPPTS